MNTGGLNIIM